MESRLTVKIGADISALQRDLQHATTTLNRFSRTFLNDMKSMALSTIGFSAALSGLKSVMGTLIGFEARMSEVRAITQATDKEFKQLRDSAIALGRTTKFSAEEVGQLQVEFGKLGFSTKEILNATEATIQLATATGEDLAKSADIAGSTLRAFNLDSSQMQKVVDVMASSFNKSALGLSNFGEAIKYVAPVAAAANISLEETTAMLGVLADNGIRGSMAGTSLRKIISDVGGESGTLSEKLAKLAAKGLSGADAMDEVGRTAYASLLILTQNTQKVNEAAEAYGNAAGEAKKMADLMSDNLAGDLKKLSASLESLVLSTSAFTGSLREMTQDLTKFVSALSASDGVLGSWLAKWFKMVTMVPRYTFKGLGWLGETFGGKGSENGATTTWDAPDSKKPLAEPVTKTLGLIQSLEEQIKKLEEAKKAAFSVGEIQSYNTQLEVAKGKLDALINAHAADKTADTTKSTAITGYFTGDGWLNAMKMLDQFKETGVKALAAVDSSMIKSGETLDQWAEKMKILYNEQMKYAAQMASIVSGAIMGIAEALGNAISGSDKFGHGLLKVIGGVLVQLGGLLITAGLGVESFKKSLQSLQGAPAIAAGIALIAIGSAVAGSIRGLGSNAGGGSSSGSGMGSRSGAGNITKAGFEIKIGGEIRISGADLVYIINRQQQLNSRTRGS